MTEINTGPPPVEVTEHYPNGNSHTASYEKTEWYCPLCGDTQVWQEQGDGDYYEGASLYCIKCDSQFSMPSPPCGPSENHTEIVEGIRAATHYTV